MSNQSAKFLTGDLMRHITVMSLSAAAGLVSVFLVDFVDLFFISLLGQSALAAAVGFAGTVLFFNMSMTIGLMIAMSALAARQLGAGNPDEARRIATSVVVVATLFAAFVAALMWIFTPEILSFLGAKGETKDFATGYLRIVLPSSPVMAFAMVSSGLLRAHGDARRAMNATLAAGAVNAILDPVLIFWVGLGLDGAALASVGARLAMALTAVYPILRHYGGFAPFNFKDFLHDQRGIFLIAGPAMLTNVATPVGAIIVTRAMASFGDEAMAAYSVIGRLSPLAFCVLFALSGAVGPIIGQNFGAKNFGRVRKILSKSLQFAGACTAIVWVLLLASHSYISNLFGLTDDGARLVFWFVLVATPLFYFNGMLFVTNAAFNNMNRPLWSTLLNWSRNIFGIAPFVWLGADLFAAPGVLIGQALGGVVFGLAAAWLSFRLVDAYESGRADPDAGSNLPLMRPRPAPPFSSPRG